jgi:1-deoxy-D-xylulose 5-phosphate reductoisomerase
VAAGVLVNVESARELPVLAAASQALGLPARVALRVNPDFELKGSGMKMGGGPKQFGVDVEQVPALLAEIRLHGLARFRDGAAIAHLGHPDMRVPIAYALTYPERAPTGVPPLELRTLEFHEPDTETFRMLPLAREAGARGGTFPCAYNAANEVAVQAFLERRIGFLEIASLVEDVLARVDGAPAREHRERGEVDRRARRQVAVA